MRPRFFVDEEERLLRWLVVGFDGERERVVPDQRAVADEVAAIAHLVEVAEHVEIRVPRFVPLGDRLVDRDVDAAHAAAVLHRVPVVEPDRGVVHLEVRVVPVRNDERHARVVAEVRRQMQVHQVFERVPVLSREPRRPGRPRVIPAMTRHCNIGRRVLQHELDAGDQEVLRTYNGMGGRQLVDLRELLVDVVADEAYEQRQHDVRDLDVLLQQLHEPDAGLEELRRPRAGDLQVIAVEPRRLRCRRFLRCASRTRP